ncbi:ABC transporter permease [Nocardia sp. NPDC058379]|uniref:ABC transporter permease n=1 Tax=unclassified Nocardia TaxID=2637762 RepID=UPI003647D27A
MATVTVWWLLSRQLDPVQLPAPGAVWTALRDGWSGIAALEYVGVQTGGFSAALLHTAGIVFVGAGVGSVLGVLVGAAIGASRTASAVLGPPLVVIGATPVLIVVPFVLIWFGTSGWAQPVLVVLFTFVTVAAATQLAVAGVSRHYLDFGACLGASRPRLFWSVSLPAAAPAVLGAVRVSFALGWSFATVSELLGSQEGTGKLLQAMSQLQRTADVVAAVLALAVLALLVDLVIARAGAYAVRWKE